MSTELPSILDQGSHPFDRVFVARSSFGNYKEVERRLVDQIGDTGSSRLQGYPMVETYADILLE